LAAQTYEFKDLVLSLNFFLHEEVLENLQSNVRSLTGEDKEINYNTTSFKNAISQLLPSKMVEANLITMNQSETFALTEDFDPRMLLTNLNLKWDTTELAFVAKGPFGLSHLGEYKINRMLNGYVEIGNRRSGDFFNIYLEMGDVETGGKVWYYFNYKNSIQKSDLEVDKNGVPKQMVIENGVLQMISSDPSFNNKITQLKPNKRKEKTSPKQTFQFTLSSPFKKDNFLARMEQKVLNQEEGSSINE